MEEKIIIDLGAFDETYANYSGADKIILVDLDSEISQYGKKPFELLQRLYTKKKNNLSDDFKKRVEEINSRDFSNKKIKIQKINSDVIDFFTNYKPRNADVIHASHLFSNIDLNLGENRNVEAQKTLLLNGLIALKEGGTFEIIENTNKVIGEKDSLQMKLIKELIQQVNKNQKLNYKFVIEKEERLNIPETVFEAIYILNEEPRHPGKIILKKVKKTEEEKIKQKNKFRIIKISPAK